MDEKVLFKISLLSGLLGIFIIFLILERVDLNDSNIGSINLTLVDQEVKIKGYITNFKETPGLYLITIKDNTGEIPVIVFKENPINLSKNQLIEIYGIIVEYKSKPEVQAKTIKVF